MAAVKNRISSLHSSQRGGLRFVAALAAPIAIYAFDVQLLFHHAALLNSAMWGWAIFYFGPLFALALVAFLVWPLFKETRRSYWASTIIFSVTVPGVAFVLAFLTVFSAMLYSVLWPEWSDYCDPGRPHQSCYVSTQKVQRTQDDVELTLGFGLFGYSSPDATVVLSQRGDVTVFRELTGVEVRLGNGPYQRLTCKIISLGPDNGGWSRIGCQIPHPEAALSESAPDTLTVRLSYGQDSYKRNFSLSSPRSKYARVVEEHRKARSH